MRKTQHTREYDRLITTLREVREEAGLTQEQVAARLQVYASFISKCESGERRIDVVELKAFCDIFKLGLFEFLVRAGLVKER
jgi:transcriptional regulator with XRE-family HTH domain